MSKISQTLLGGAALFALATAPAMAGDVPDIHVAALHPGHATFVRKTRMHLGNHVHHSCSTIVISTTVPASDFRSVVKLAGTYYTFYDSGTFCNSSEKQKVKLRAKKTQYAKLGTSTETYSGYCSTAPTVFYGDTYDLKKKKGEGKTDSFVSTLVGKNIHYNGGIYDINLPMEVVVHIGQ
jgi:hypothetical protein